ncbi:LLM class flavin-dependent oxidoreductase [Microbacterium sp. NPDC091313]
MSGGVSIGVAGALGPDAVARIAADVEARGFTALWVNDTPDGDALAALAAAAAATSTLELATGVVPVDRRPAADIVRAARALPAERVVIGIGSGQARHGALALVSDAVGELRAAGIGRVVVGALGPRMRRLGAESADGVLLNWVPAADVAAQRRQLREVRAGTRVAVYVRTALDPAAHASLAAEAARYASFPNYAANFARLGVGAMDTVFDGAEALAHGIGAYRDAADEVVLRAIVPTHTPDAYAAFIARAAEEAGL